MAISLIKTPNQIIEGATAETYFSKYKKSLYVVESDQAFLYEDFRYEWTIEDADGVIHETIYNFPDSDKYGKLDIHNIIKHKGIIPINADINDLVQYLYAIKVTVYEYYDGTQHASQVFLNNISAPIRYNPDNKLPFVLSKLGTTETLPFITDSYIDEYKTYPMNVNQKGILAHVQINGAITPDMMYNIHFNSAWTNKIMMIAGSNDFRQYNYVVKKTSQTYKINLTLKELQTCTIFQTTQNSTVDSVKLELTDDNYLAFTTHIGIDDSTDTFTVEQALLVDKYYKIEIETTSTGVDIILKDEDDTVIYSESVYWHFPIHADTNADTLMILGGDHNLTAYVHHFNVYTGYTYGDIILDVDSAAVDTGANTATGGHFSSAAPYQESRLIRITSYITSLLFNTFCSPCDTSSTAKIHPHGLSDIMETTMTYIENTLDDVITAVTPVSLTPTEILDLFDSTVSDIEYIFIRSRLGAAVVHDGMRYNINQCPINDISLMWIGLHGSTENFPFSKRTLKNISVINKSFKYNPNDIYADPDRSETKIYNQEIEQTFILKTDWLEKYQEEYLIGLTLSKDIIMYIDGVKYPVESIQKKQTISDHTKPTLVILEFEVKLSKNIN